MASGTLLLFAMWSGIPTGRSFFRTRWKGILRRRLLQHLCASGQHHSFKSSAYIDLYVDQDQFSIQKTDLFIPSFSISQSSHYHSWFVFSAPYAIKRSHRKLLLRLENRFIRIVSFALNPVVNSFLRMQGRFSITTEKRTVKNITMLLVEVFVRRVWSRLWDDVYRVTALNCVWWLYMDMEKLEIIPYLPCDFLWFAFWLCCSEDCYHNNDDDGYHFNVSCSHWKEISSRAFCLRFVQKTTSSDIRNE